MIKNILVIGGGSAGWIVAHMLRSLTDCNITLLRSPKISTIGVGEGTTTFFSAFLNKWCPWLNENDFIRETNSTFKVGSKFEDWTEIGSVYTTPSDSLGMPPESQDYWPASFDLLRTYAVANNLSTNPTIENLILDNHKSPYIKNKSFGHAYHFDAELAINYFQSKSKLVNINEIISTITDVTIDQNNHIESIILDDGRKLSFDFYIDCTGFARFFAKKLQNNFISWKDHIIVDRAINFPVPILENEKIPTFTLAKARKSGWSWKVPTYHRYGSGYIFSSNLNTVDDIVEELREFGIKDYIQEIKFESGYLERGWIGNCMFSGLCSGFVEPMEATSLHSSLCNLWVFLKDYFKPNMDLNDKNLQDRYNNLYWKPYWESVRDWITLHYLGGREDTKFWKAIKDINIPDTLQSLLELWKIRMPRITESSSDTVWQHSLIFGVTNGLNILDREVAENELKYYQMEADGKELYNMYKNKSLELFKYTVDHRAHLDYIRNFKK